MLRVFFPCVHLPLPPGAGACMYVCCRTPNVGPDDLFSVTPTSPSPAAASSLCNQEDDPRLFSYVLSSSAKWVLLIHYQCPAPPFPLLSFIFSLSHGSSVQFKTNRQIAVVLTRSLRHAPPPPSPHLPAATSSSTVGATLPPPAPPPHCCGNHLLGLTTNYRTAHKQERPTDDNS